jgi:hypothetical protein
MRILLCLVAAVSLNAQRLSPLHITPLGGAQPESARAIALDPRGSVYLAGDENGQAFVARLTPSMNRVLWRTAFDGTIRALVAAPDGTVWACGDSRGDAVLLHFGPDGAELAKRRIGGNGDDSASGITLGPDGSVVIAGTTNSPDFPVTPGAWQQTRKGASDAFIAAFNAADLGLRWSEYLGGSGAENAAAAVFDASGQLWLAGTTDSPDFPALVGLPLHSRGASDGFLVQLNPADGSWRKTALLGGNGADRVLALAPDTASGVIAGGDTDSGDWPAGSDPKGGLDSWACRFPGGGCTRVGGPQDDSLSAVYSTSDRIWAAGWTASPRFPILNAPDFGHGGARDAWLATFDSANWTLLQSAVFGGAGDDTISAIAVRGPAAWTAGSTDSDRPILTSTPLQPVPGGGGDAILSLWTASSTPLPVSANVEPVAGGAQVTATLLHPEGYNSIRDVNVNLSNPLSPFGACWVTWFAAGSRFALANDAGDGYVESNANSQCRLIADESSVRGAGSEMTLSIRVEPSAAFAATGPVKLAGVSASDWSDRASGWAVLGEWNLKLENAVPLALEASPVSGEGLRNFFTFAAHDADGPADIAEFNVLFASSLYGGQACWVTWFRDTGAFALANDSGEGYAGTVEPGRPGSVANGQCTLDGPGSAAGIHEGKLYMRLNITFAPEFAAAGGTPRKAIYLLPVDASGAHGEWRQFGWWTVAAP